MWSVTGYEKEKYNHYGTPCATDLPEPLGSSTDRIPHSFRKRYVLVLILKFLGKISPSLMVELEYHNKALKGGK